MPITPKAQVELMLFCNMASAAICHSRLEHRRSSVVSLGRCWLGTVSSRYKRADHFDDELVVAMAEMIQRVGNRIQRHNGYAVYLHAIMTISP